MNAPETQAAQVDRLVAHEAPSDGDQPAVVGRLQRLCRAAARALPASGVAVSLISDLGHQMTVAASASSVERVEELQFSLGEGPSLEAHASRRPVLVPDLHEGGRSRWTAYEVAAAECDVRAVFAFPLQVGAARLGVMDVYRREAGALSPERIGLALTFAEVAMSSLIDAQAGLPTPGHVLDDAVDNRYVVFQAQGIVAVQLGVGLAEAMARIRAHGYADDRRLNDVADDIVAGRLVLRSDPP